MIFSGTIDIMYTNVIIEKIKFVNTRKDWYQFFIIDIYFSNNFR